MGNGTHILVELSITDIDASLISCSCKSFTSFHLWNVIRINSFTGYMFFVKIVINSFLAWSNKDHRVVVFSNPLVWWLPLGADILAFYDVGVILIPCVTETISVVIIDFNEVFIGPCPGCGLIRLFMAVSNLSESRGLFEHLCFGGGGDDRGQK